MTKTMRGLGLLAALAVLFLACGQEQKVGSERLLEFEEQRNQQRLGERTPPPEEPDATPAPLTVGEERTPAPTPPPAAAATPRPTAQTFDVFLVPDSPYYRPGNQLVVRVGVTMRVVNQDTTPERTRGRSFTDKAGSFHSGMLRPGESWTWVFDRPARYQIIDEGLPFATATLEVVS